MNEATLNAIISGVSSLAGTFAAILAAFKVIKVELTLPMPKGRGFY